MTNADWPGLMEEAGLLNWYIGAWHDLGYENPPAPECKEIPPLGERSAAAISAGHDAVRQIDKMSRELQVLRDQLIAELRTDEDVRAARVDKMLAEGKQALAAEGTDTRPAGG